MLPSERGGIPIMKVGKKVAVAGVGNTIMYSIVGKPHNWRNIIM